MSRRERRSPRKLIGGVVVAALLLVPVPFSHAMTGDVIVDDCVKSLDPFNPLEGGVCWGYLLGVWHTHNGYQRAGRVPRTVCADDPIPIGDLVRAYLIWAKEKTPEALSRDASECVLDALRATYPCPAPGE